MNEIKICKVCDAFTMESRCSCGGDTLSPIPQRYSPEEKYVDLKRQAKHDERVAEGLL